MSVSKTVLITGSTSGIGLGIAREFAKAGYSIAFNGLEENASEIAENVGKEFNIKTGFYGANLSDVHQIEEMIIELSELSNKCIEEMREIEKLIMSKEDKKKFFNAPCCSICNEPFKTDEIRCRDHDHRTGQFRGATSKM